MCIGVVEDDERASGGSSDPNRKKQAVIALDMQMWEDLIEAFNMKGQPSMILHRKEADHSNIGAKGWYA